MKTNIQITTSNDFGNFKITSYKGLVSSKIVIGANFFADFFASFTDVFGGRSGAYQSRLNEIYDDAIKQVSEEARKKRANGIIALSVDFDEISGKEKSMFMVSVIGTAVCVDFNDNDNEQSSGLSDASVSKEQLETAIKCYALKASLNRGIALGESDWQYLNGNKDVAECIVKAYTKSDSGDVDNVVQYLNSLDYDTACDVLYNRLEGEHGDKKKVVLFITKCFLFNPQRIIQLIENGKIDMTHILQLLCTDKMSYDVEDLNKMKRICDMFDNLPDRGEIRKTTTGVFKKTEIEVFVCANGHEMPIDAEYCPSCLVNRKGIYKHEMKKIDTFKVKTEILQGILEDKSTK